MAEIQKQVVKQGKRSAASRLFHAKNDKDAIATWMQELNKILHIFNVRSVGLLAPIAESSSFRRNCY